MNDIELLEKEVVDICKGNEIDFNWYYDDILNEYVMKFKKLDRSFGIVIRERDLYVKPFAIVISEVKHLLDGFISETK